MFDELAMLDENYHTDGDVIVIDKKYRDIAYTMLKTRYAADYLFTYDKDLQQLLFTSKHRTTTERIYVRELLRDNNLTNYTETEHCISINQEYVSDDTYKTLQKAVAYWNTCYNDSNIDIVKLRIDISSADRVEFEITFIFDDVTIS